MGAACAIAHGVKRTCSEHRERCPMLCLAKNGARAVQRNVRAINLTGSLQIEFAKRNPA
jgi:hypothetical protein